MGLVAGDEFVSEADIAAQRLPSTLKLVNDLQVRQSTLGFRHLGVHTQKLLDFIAKPT